jgi:hypothetical protein
MKEKRKSEFWRVVTAIALIVILIPLIPFAWLYDKIRGNL